MWSNTEHETIESAVRMHGPKRARAIYEERRGRALDRGDHAEADCWDAKWIEVGVYVARRRSQYNFFSLIGGATIASIPTGYVWLERWGSASIATLFIVLSLVLYLAVRFVDRLVARAAGLFFLAAIGAFGWQAYSWLRTAEWPGLSVAHAISWFGLAPSFVSVDGWLGISRMVNLAYVWLLALSLPLACLLVAGLLGFLAMFMERFDIPKLKEEEEI